MVCQYFLQHFLVNYNPKQVPAFSAWLAWSKPQGGKRFCKLVKVFLDTQTSGAVSYRLWYRIAKSRGRKVSFYALWIHSLKWFPVQNCVWNNVILYLSYQPHLPPSSSISVWLSGLRSTHTWSEDKRGLFIPAWLQIEDHIYKSRQECHAWGIEDF